MNEPDYDAADEACAEAGKELEHDLIDVISQCARHLSTDQVALLCYGAGIDRRLIKMPQRRAA